MAFPKEMMHGKDKEKDGEHEEKARKSKEVEKAHKEPDGDEDCGPAMKAKKSHDKSEMDKSEDGDEHEKKEKVEKSISVSDEELSKSASALESLIKSGISGRKQDLLQKAQSGLLTEDEIGELSLLLKGKGPKDDLAKSIERAMSPESNETFAKALDVSDYLPDLHNATTAALSAIADQMQKSEMQRQDQVVVLAKALLDITKLTQQNTRLLKSLQGNGRMPTAPVRQPKGAATAAMVPGARQIPAQMQLAKGEVLDTLGELFQKSLTSGGEGRSQASGEMYDLAATKYENSNEINPSLLQEIIAYRRARFSGAR